MPKINHITCWLLETSELAGVAGQWPFLNEGIAGLRGKEREGLHLAVLHGEFDLGR